MTTSSKPTINIPAQEKNQNAFLQGLKPGPEHKGLEIFIGKWINEGHTISDKGAPGVKILTSDVYEWMPGSFFILHTAYGRIGEIEVGGTEIIAYEPTEKKYKSYFFDSQGHVTVHELTIQGNRWVWLGERTKATATFEDNGKTQKAFHERLDENGNWIPAMDVTLRKVE